MNPTPPDILEFSRKLRAHDGTLRVSLEKGGLRTGEWWIDIHGGRSVVIEWRPGRGFILPSSDPVRLKTIHSASDAALETLAMAR